MRKISFQHSRASLIFGVITALFSASMLVATVVLTLNHHPYRAVWVLGGTIATLGLLRGLWPGDPWFGSRFRWLDVVAYIALGVTLIMLSPWVVEMSMMPPK